MYSFFYCQHYTFFYDRFHMSILIRLMNLKHYLLAFLISFSITLFLENAFLDRISQPLQGVLDFELIER